MENNELLDLMEKCGHFLYHRRGGKRGQMRILSLLDKLGAVTQKELMQHLPLKSGSLSEMVGKLESQGFIIKERDKEDKRKINIILTSEGKKFLDSCLVLSREQEQLLFTSLSQAEQQELTRLLSKLFRDWQSKFDGNLFDHRRDDSRV